MTARPAQVMAAVNVLTIDWRHIGRVTVGQSFPWQLTAAELAWARPGMLVTLDSDQAPPALGRIRDIDAGTAVARIVLLPGPPR